MDGSEGAHTLLSRDELCLFSERIRCICRDLSENNRTLGQHEVTTLQFEEANISTELAG